VMSCFFSFRFAARRSSFCCRLRGFFAIGSSLFFAGRENRANDRQGGKPVPRSGYQKAEGDNNRQGDRFAPENAETSPARRTGLAGSFSATAFLRR
jgi:hypothetical protein